MGLKCSMLGHAWGDPETEREREEQGSEVVVTVREVNVCARCGEREVVSENKEVRSIVSDEGADDGADLEHGVVFGDVDDDGAAGDSDGAGTEADDSSEVDVAITEAEGDDAVFVDEDAAASGDAADGRERDAGGPTPDGRTAEGSDGDDSPEDVAAADDAVIIDDEPAAPEPEPEPGRGHGEWPDSDDVGTPPNFDREPSEWPGKEDPTAASARRELPEDADLSTEDVEVETAEPVSGITSAGQAPSPASARSGSEAQFYCPQCGHAVPSTRTSLRVGDICPECRRGYLSERE